ncbi:MAG: hypothetical protein WBV31_14600 [Terriglobales bacterium]|jgi:hypothetical protein
MKKAVLAICIVLVSASPGFAATVGNSSLKGTYSFQLGGPHMDWWSASITCYDPHGNPYTVSGGGSDVSSESIVGTITFDGKGNLTGAYTKYGSFDQAASNATILLSCSPGVGNSGYAVYDPPSTGTFKGTYSVQSNGTGALTLALSSGESVGFVLELGGTAAVRTSVFLTEFDSTTNKVDVSGSAVLQ